jgi:hypothetical protein
MTLSKSDLRDDAVSVAQDVDNAIISLPAWQAAQRRLDDYLVLLGANETTRRQWASAAFVRALRRQRPGDIPLRVAMEELQAVLREAGNKEIGDQTARLRVTLPAAPLEALAPTPIARTALRPARLGGAWRRRLWLKLQQLGRRLRRGGPATR